MKKTIHINLGEFPFIIDEDAYQALEEYITRLEYLFSSQVGGKEVVNDIENRFSELLVDRLSIRKVVNLNDVRHVMGQLGSPESFVEDDFASGSASGSTSGNEIPYQNKRLYRDMNDKVIAGVCGGIARYFGIEEAVWVRIAFLAMGAAGFPLFLYVLFWALVPAVDFNKVPEGGETLGSVLNSVKSELNQVKINLKRIFDKFTKKNYQL